MENTNILWQDIIKKEARGLNDDDLGEVKSVEGDHVFTRAGIIDKISYRLPKSLVQRYDGHNLVFNISKEEANEKYRTHV
ncbi:MAG TPA: hypothetical protein VJ729_11510 [Nitrososphaeraceae archaeon]|nr:hypothetical protein [Nitrososphaeraceae archaeon]